MKNLAIFEGRSTGELAGKLVTSELDETRHIDATHDSKQLLFNKIFLLML